MIFGELETEIYNSGLTRQLYHLIRLCWSLRDRCLVF